MSPACRLAELITIFIMPASIDYKYHTCATFLCTRIHILYLDRWLGSYAEGEVIEIVQVVDLSPCNG